MPRAIMINGISAILITATAPRPGASGRLIKNKFHITKSTASAANEAKLMMRLMRKRGSSHEVSPTVAQIALSVDPGRCID